MSITPYARHTTWEGYDTIVVGSGMGGLSTAVLLARYGGQRVLVLEQHYEAGGFTHTFRRPGGFEWDVGVHYIGGVLRSDTFLARLWHQVTGGRVRWASLGPVYDRIVVGDRVVDLPAGRRAWLATLQRAFPQQAAAVERYAQAVRAAQRAGRGLFAARALPRGLGWWGRGGRGWARQRTGPTLKRLGVTAPDLAAVLTAQYGDYGLPPGQSSFLMHALLVHHYWYGAAYPVGGAGVLARAAAHELARLGGAVVVRAAVERLLLDARGRVMGVRLRNGHEIRAPRVVSNAGFATTFLHLLPPDHPYRPRAQAVVRRVGLSAGHLNLYVGLDRDARTLDLPPYNLWLHPTPDLDARWERAQADPHADFPFVFLSSASARDPDAARRMPGRATLQAIAPAAWAPFAAWASTRWQRRGPDYAALKTALTQRLLEVVYRALPQVRGHVVHAELSTPLSTAHFTGHPQGAIYGLAATPARFTTPDLRPDTAIPGLYLTGVDIVTPGVAGALVSGLFTAAAVLRRRPRALLRLLRLDPT